MSIEIICGEARETLAALPASSAQCVMTSPPYFGLRSYQTAGQVWGGDQACTHTWSAASRALEQGNKRTPVDTDHDRDRSQDKAVPQTVALATARCASCDAWRGELGAEDTPQEYVAHLVEVFRAVHRVLRDDGTCWIVMGSSFATGTIESDDYVMRDDLTDQERAYVYAELAKHFESQSEALSAVRQADASPEPTLPHMLPGTACPTGQLCGEDL